MTEKTPDSEMLSTEFETWWNSLEVARMRLDDPIPFQIAHAAWNAALAQRGGGDKP